MSRSPSLGAICVIALAACAREPGMPITIPSPDRVAVGYGTQPAAQSGGSVQSASADALRDRSDGRAEELFVGRFPGVRVLRGPTGGLLISIRGSGMLSPGRQPLYIVDGQPVEITPEHGLDWLVPADIQRITLLKDPAETAMYGGRGANGVILITTKLRP